MGLKIHHLNCGSMHPTSARLINGSGGWLEPTKMVTRVLLIETPSQGLVLVDSGFGTRDIAAPSRLGKMFIAVAKPSLHIDETALAQVRRLGYDASDVLNIIMTHLDLDHTGGLADFPEAEVHVFASEYAAAMNPTFRERPRYRSAHWAHGPRWATYSRTDEIWQGLGGVCPIAELNDELLMVPLPGHTRGHAGVAVRKNEGWMLHCGDAYFFYGQVDRYRSDNTSSLSLYQKFGSADAKALARTQKKLTELMQQPDNKVEFFCTHDAAEFARYS